MLRNLHRILIPILLTLAAGPASAMLIRSADGSSNNLANSDWGRAGAALIRLTRNGYLDGRSVPRGGDPSALPSARAISNAVAAQSGPDYNAHGASDWLWQWGQFLDHDLDLTGPAPVDEPFNVRVPRGDPYFDPFNTGTAEIELQRSLYEPDSAGVRQQVNEITSFIDASNIYGSDPARAAILRNDLGYLRMSAGMNGEVLMGYNDGGYDNAAPPGSEPADFFLSGDVRANEQIGLTATHTLFAREHNRLVDELKARLDGGDSALVAERDATIAAMGNGVDSEGDFIYEAARKIVGAEIQKITYGEFLPLLLGVDLTAGYTGYDTTVDPGISNEFSGAAFRVGHTMLSPSLLRIDDGGATPVSSEVRLRDAFFNPAEIFENGVDSLLLGLARQRSQTIDTLVVDDVRNFLFGPPGAGGFDLASLNIQRGRDHGIDALNAVRAALGLGAYGSFLEMTGGDAALAAAFAAVYVDVDEVDLWIGALAEGHYGTGMLGDTFNHILIDQFMRSMVGDRFFYLGESDILSILDPDFMAATTLAGVIRRNSSIRDVQDNVFLVVPEPSSLALCIIVLLLSTLRITSGPVSGGFRALPGLDFAVRTGRVGEAFG